jgi:hypothetical protein
METVATRPRKEIAMTDKEKAAQYGEVLFEIATQERELAALLGRAKRIGAALVSIGERLRDRPFGISQATDEGPVVVTAGGAFGDQRALFDYEAIASLESEINQRARELQRLRSLRSQLKP